MSGRKVHRFVVKDSYLFIFIILISMMFLSAVLLTLGEVKKRYMYSEYKQKLELKQKLMAGLNKLDEEIKTLHRKVDLHSKFNDKLRYATDIPVLERKLRVKGVGGPSAIDTLRENLSDDSYKLVSHVIKEVNFSEKLVELEKESYKEVKKKLGSTIDLKKHTPSIWPTSGYISSGFGYRRHPIKRTIEFHRGLDIANLPGTNIYATADGVVDFAGRQAGYGNYLSINHGYGFKTKYGHLRKILVKEGQEVKRGDIIAKMGSSGLATGPHLHYEVRIVNKPVNPFHYIIRDTLTY
jgi:murein DD-endopeptidase MepM/ murein hydrolase activator NlpD